VIALDPGTITTIQGVGFLDSGIRFISAMVVVVHHINSSNATAPTPPHLVMQDQPAKSLTRKSTQPLSAGTGSMSLMVQITKVQVLLMVWTQIGMWILELLIILRETLKSFPLVIVMVARIRLKQQMFRYGNHSRWSFYCSNR
jgi:hypothetical protein